jgi:hypothetical protein
MVHEEPKSTKPSRIVAEQGEKLRKEGQDFAKFLDSLPADVRDRTHKKQREHSESEYREFREAFGIGKCFLCEEDLSAFVKTKPCPHWLLVPAGFTKHDFPLILERFGFFQIQTFLRWIAGEEAFATNINDLPEEGSGKLFEVTIRYKDCEWSFSCGDSDYLGHGTSEHASHPHYHFQMRYKKQAFIRFNDFHIPFLAKDVQVIEAMRTSPNIRIRHSGPPGMTELLNSETVEELVKLSSSEGAEENAPLKLDTIITAEEGTRISGDAIYEILREARSKGLPVASLVHKLPNVRVQTIVTPGPGVVEQATRRGRGRGKRDPER